MLIRSCLAGAVLGLAAGAAYAQKTPDNHVDMPIQAQTGEALQRALAPPPAPSAVAATDAAVEVSATELSIFNRPETPYVTDRVSGPLAGTEVLVTNGPVPDTPENRARYRPLSNAGRNTAAIGN